MVGHEEFEQLVGVWRVTDAEDTLNVLNKLIDQQNAMRSGQVSR